MRWVPLLPDRWLLLFVAAVVRVNAHGCAVGASASNIDSMCHAGSEKPSRALFDYEHLWGKRW